MPRCIGTAATTTGGQCKTNGLYHCPKCDADLCSWHVLWENGAHCLWCGVTEKPLVYSFVPLKKVRREYYDYVDG